MPRGGRRTGTPGVAYQNRTDLNGAPKPLPIQTAPGQQYGMATAQRAAQQAVPMAPAPTSVPPASGPSAPPPALGPLPGALTPLHAPSERPDEHVMSGVSVGPGAGPEALNGLGSPTQQYQTARDHVSALASTQPDNSALQYLAAQLAVRF